MNQTEFRLQRIREQFSTWDVDAILIGSPTNRRWLSGFSGSSGRLLITRQQAILATDSRYWDQARTEAPGFELYKDRRQHEDTITLIGSVNGERIGLEANQVTLADAAKLESIANVTWVPLGQPVEPLRQIKSVSEIEAIRAAAAITDQAMALVPQLAHIGINERELAWELEKTMRESGADAMAFPLIVAFGPNSALPHHHPSDRRLREGEIVLVDMGAEFNGYKSDLTRTFFVGREPDEQFLTVYNLVNSALRAAANNIQPEINSRKAYNLAMDVISDGGHREHFSHGLGHGVGLDIHEEPFLSATLPAVKITAGMVITIEPGIYLPGWGGVRIEDLVLVTETGVEAISKCPKITHISI
jgi:Xaa-Pro aminopeptidase